MRRPPFAAGTVATAAVLALAGAALAPRPAEALPEDGDTAPPFHVAKWVGGGPYEVAKLEGKVLAVVFCGVENAEIETYVPKWNKIAEAYPPAKGLYFFALTRADAITAEY